MQRLYPLDLQKLRKEHKNFEGLFITRIRQLSLVDYVFEFSHNKNLFVSLNNPAPFVVFNADLKDFPEGGELHSFAIYLRKFLSGKLLAIEQPNEDMTLALVFERKNNILETEKVTLFIELIPHHPQAVLVDENMKIFTAFRHHQERAKDGRFIRGGNNYSLPKKTYFNTPKISAEQDRLSDYLKENHERIKKQNFRDLYVYLEKNIKRLRRLVANYKRDLEKLSRVPNLYHKANLLLTYKPAIYSDFLQIEGEIVEVDPRFDALVNAEIMFKKAKKIKKSEEILQEKIKEAQEKIIYLQGIEKHLEGLESSGEIFQIYEELDLLKRRDKRQIISKLNPYLITYKNIDILFGKNNKQNDYLTFKIANKKDTFMHIQNRPGSHIIIRHENPSKDTLEFAGMLCLFLAKQVDGEIMYTKVNDIKKGAFPGQVLVRSSDTFFLRYKDELSETFKNEIKRYYK